VVFHRAADRVEAFADGGVLPNDDHLWGWRIHGFVGEGVAPE